MTIRRLGSHREMPPGSTSPSRPSPERSNSKRWRWLIIVIILGAGVTLGATAWAEYENGAVLVPSVDFNGSINVGVPQLVKSVTVHLYLDQIQFPDTRSADLEIEVVLKRSSPKCWPYIIDLSQDMRMPDGFFGPGRTEVSLQDGPNEGNPKQIVRGWVCGQLSKVVNLYATGDTIRSVADFRGYFVALRMPVIRQVVAYPQDLLLDSLQDFPGIIIKYPRRKSTVLSDNNIITLQNVPEV